MPAWPATWTTKQGSSTLHAGLQKLTADTAWVRVNGASGGTLVNDRFNSSFDNTQERTWQCSSRLHAASGRLLPEVKGRCRPFASGSQPLGQSPAQACNPNGSSTEWLGWVNQRGPVAVM
ncbi:hypothetical protein PspS04_10855 [Pseudomonas sp. S04]|nr:hypothetical protein PspS04_10855 [Pseudomonas sp. S04]QHF33307.1 hypothetical protein PspS19_10860 [Pseudomonas sp. S19]